jgi:hypothetical protein
MDGSSHRLNSRPAFRLVSRARETANSQRAARYSKIFVLARAVFEAALPTEDVLVELLDSARHRQPPKTSATAAVVHAV